LRKKELVVSIGGGLGNQLFQFAATQRFSASHEIYIEKEFLKPRNYTNGISELESVRFPIAFRVKHVKDLNGILSKSLGYLLSRSSKKKLTTRFQIVFLIIIKAFCTLYLMICCRKYYKIVVSDNLGYSALDLREKNYWLIGYFQSYLYLDAHALNFFREIEPVSPSKNFDNLFNKAKEARPCIIHLRLGDYLKENEFGIPSRKYYDDAIKHLLDSGFNGQFWVFSDDLAEAKVRLNRVDVRDISYISTEKLSSIEVLKVMSQGSCFVIANSTFSYWAATISISNVHSVIAPKTWFSQLSEPDRLIPQNWLRIESKERSFS